VDWWQTVMILSGIGVISVIIGMFAGIPLSNIILRRREQVSISKYRMSSKFKPQYTTTDQLDDLLKKYGVLELKTAEQGSEETAERGNDEAETIVEQIEPVAIDRILLELEKNHELSIEPRLDNLKPFQTDTWDASLDIPNVLTADLKWELAEAYDDQYTKMCNQIAITLSKVIQILKNAKK